MVLTDATKKKRQEIISVPPSPELKSSSSDDEHEDSQEEDDGEVSEDDYDDDTDENYEDSSNGEDDDDDSGGSVAGDDPCEKVIDLLKRQQSLDVLKLEQCKAYLRKHSLRLSGTKAACIERIQEHWRIKDGNGEMLYPKSSFVINCTGDVCKGDVVLFMQKIFSKFDKVTRGANVIGKRIVAGRILKESYGSAKQQHTFTVEILWSKGDQPLPPLFPLLVKGRNLYRLKTFRQPWDDEAERVKVLDEKHQRGAAARCARAISRRSNVKKGFKRQKKCSTKGDPRKRQRRAEIMPPGPNSKPNNHYKTVPADCHGMAKHYKAGSGLTQFCAPSISPVHGKAEKVGNTRFPASSTSVFPEETHHHHGSEIYTRASSFHNETAPANSPGNAKDWNAKCPVSSLSGLLNETHHHYGSEIYSQFCAPSSIYGNAKKVSDTSSTASSSSGPLKETHHHGTEVHNIQFGAPSFRDDTASSNSHGNSKNCKTRFPGSSSGLWKETHHHRSEIHAQFHASSFHNGTHNHGNDIHYTQFHAPSFHPGTTRTTRVNNSPRRAKKVWNRKFPLSSSSGLPKESHYHGKEIHHTQYRAPSFHHETAEANSHWREIRHTQYHANSNGKAKKTRYTRFPGSPLTSLSKEMHHHGSEIHAKFNTTYLHYPCFNADYNVYSYTSRIDSWNSGHMRRAS